MIYKSDHDLTVSELTLDFVEGLYTRYVPDNSLIIFDGINVSDIAIPKGVSHLIFDAATNPVDIRKLLDRINLNNFYILTGLYSYHKNKPQDPRIKFFPFWAVWSSTVDDLGFQDQPKKYKISCLNGTNWNHRKLIYIELSKKSYFADMVFSFKNQSTPQDLGNDLQLTSEEHDQFSLLPPGIKFLPDDGNDIDLTLDHPAYRETYVNLVTETNINALTPMLSEKSFKPIIAGQLFVLIASPGAVQFLRDIGIDTFDDLIDHGYDGQVDPRSRIRDAIKQIDRLMTLNLAEIYTRISPRLKRNSEYLKSIEFRRQFPLTFNM
jgi:hypothetical protein